jgi:hypothetical protein
VPFARAVLRAVTWKVFLAAQLLALGFGLLRYLQHGPQPPPHFFHTHLISRAVGAVFVMLAALAANEAVRRGSGMWRVYPAALLAGSCVGALVQWHLRGWLGVIDFTPDAGTPFWRVTLVALDAGAFGGLAMLAYLNRQSADRMLQGVRAADLERVRVERHLIESRLATAEAHTDPRSVFRQLAEIRNLYATARPGADERLETLIQELRASVAQSATALRESAL